MIHCPERVSVVSDAGLYQFTEAAMLGLPSQDSSGPGASVHQTPLPRPGLGWSSGKKQLGRAKAVLLGFALWVLRVQRAQMAHPGTWLFPVLHAASR